MRESWVEFRAFCIKSLRNPETADEHMMFLTIGLWIVNDLAWVAGDIWLYWGLFAK
jgi:hypothetical protein